MRNMVSLLRIGKDCIRLTEVKSSLYTRELYLKAYMNDDNALSSEMVVFKKDNKVKKQKKMKTNPDDPNEYCKQLEPLCIRTHHLIKT